ncbi:heme exporter protein CcmD [Enterobacteriaceae bacterium H20N1]|uniref:Heme exporter protein D n=1 Tax=Dryocola boscaweniae TaxID=2925397 RepID=A0A9X3ABD3_9ENTR|nr:heme exporter protein CcmD [Dryocola boscaweniae]MCT4702349.1 heme exporter protein CcmD [Dryocola boscaweniae]MCT4719517.1 heme exporter protein CcmD [Dryocola boscaweniae]
MNGAFASWADFFAMGGYAFFVWLAVAFTVIPLLALLIHTRLHRREILNGVERQQAREQRIRAQKQTEGR